ncbi:MAG TPA: DUF2393 domain-containing protein [Sulfurimonas autotrophica]|nr:DUF2393 domain-containing protein [Sulfurimonas autotrophica]
MTLFNYWHYIILSIIFIVTMFGIVAALKQKNKKLIYPMLFSVGLVALFMAVFSIFIVDKYTKKVELTKLYNKRLLSTEEIVYYGIVKNTGKFPIGKVTFEVKLVNKGYATGNVKGGSFYKPSGFMNFFTEGFGMSSNKPQTVTQKFIVARNLKPGRSKEFRVYFHYPPYFRSTAEFTKVYGH